MIMDENITNKGITILIAEDEESNFLLLKTILKKHCNILHAKTGVELLEIYKEQHADLILLDIKMPEMNGIDALKEIRKFDQDIPIIMQSAYAFENDMEAARQAGSNVCNETYQHQGAQKRSFQFLAAVDMVISSKIQNKKGDAYYKYLLLISNKRLPTH